MNKSLFTKLNKIYHNNNNNNNNNNHNHNNRSSKSIQD